MKRFISILLCLPLLAFGQTGTEAVKKDSDNDRITENLTIGTGRTVATESGSTLTLGGAVGGTVTSGTLSLANTTLTLPAAATWAAGVATSMTIQPSGSGTDIALRLRSKNDGIVAIGGGDEVEFDPAASTFTIDGARLVTTQGADINGVSIGDSEGAYHLDDEGELVAGDAHVNSLTIDSVPIDPLAGQLFLWFTFYHVDSERLWVLSSPDGVTWDRTTSLPGFTPLTGNTRDPSVVIWGNYYYVAYTSGIFGGVNYFTIIRSKDRVNWEFVAQVDCSDIGSLTQTWSPDFFIEGDDIYVFFSASTDNTVHQTLYYVTSEDMVTWTDPIEVGYVAAPDHCDGPQVKKYGSTYYLWYSHKDGGDYTIEIASSSSLTTGYTPLQTGDFANFQDTCGTKIEGQTIGLLANGVTRMWFENFENNVMYYTDSAGPPFATWTTPVEITPPEIGGHPSHGVIIRLASTEATNTSAISGPQPKPFFLAVKTATQSINNNTATEVTYPVEVADSQGVYDSSTSRFTLSKGIWRISATVNLSSPGSGTRYEIGLFKGGVNYTNIVPGGGVDDTTPGTNDTSRTTSWVVDANGTDYYSVGFFHLKGSAMTIGGSQGNGNGRMSVAGEWLGFK